MSNTNRHPNWLNINGDINAIKNNKDLTKSITKLLYYEFPKNTYKSVANTLDISLYVVRHWFQGHTNISAIYLYKMVINFKIIRDFLGICLIPEKIPDNLRKENRERNFKKVLEMLKGDPKLSMREISIQLNLSPKKVEYIFLKLKDREILKRVGATKNGKWDLKMEK